MNENCNWQLFEWREFKRLELIPCGTSLCSSIENLCYAVIYVVTCPLTTGDMDITNRSKKQTVTHNKN
jgi:hypothetical protein